MQFRLYLNALVPHYSLKSEKRDQIQEKQNQGNVYQTIAFCSQLLYNSYFTTVFKIFFKE